jgi:hypothetical protein
MRRVRHRFHRRRSAGRLAVRDGLNEAAGP